MNIPKRLSELERRADAEATRPDPTAGKRIFTAEDIRRAYAEIARRLKEMGLPQHAEYWLCKASTPRESEQ